MKRLCIILAILALSVPMVCSVGNAVTDVIEYPSGYFVDTDANKYNSPYYRFAGQDWGWTHNSIGGTITSATLNISAYDVDYVSWDPSRWPVGERDQIFAYDNGIKTSLGYLAGAGDTWSYTAFILGSNFYDDIAAGLQVYMEIDQANEGWQVTLAKSVLATEGSDLPGPAPGAVPEPTTMLLLGSGLIGLGAYRRKKFFKK